MCVKDDDAGLGSCSAAGEKNDDARISGGGACDDDDIADPSVAAME